MESRRRERELKVDQWRKSGKSAKAWCQENGLVYPTFLGWIHQSRKLKKSTAFIEIKDAPQTFSGISLEYEGILINISANFDSKTLNQCLQVLRGQKC